MIAFENNTFSKNIYEGNLINAAWEYKNCSQNLSGTFPSQIMPQMIISHCCFTSNKYIHFIRLMSLKLVKIVAEISSTIFEEMAERRNDIANAIPTIVIANVFLSLRGPVTFHKVDITRNLTYTNTHILVTGNISCSHIQYQSKRLNYCNILSSG